MVSYRRVREKALKIYAEKKKLIGVPLLFVLFILLSSRGDITITGYSGDSICAGTLEDPCMAFLNFTANTNIYIYPMNETGWMFGTDIPMKELRMYRTWGSGWREIKMNKTWSKRVKYAVKFSNGKSYQLKFVGLKNDPFQDIYWSFGDLDE